MDSRDNNVTPPEESPRPTPVLRVTAETTPAPSRPSKLKDEKKAAAGRASAVARKAKTERLERELAAAKEALRDPAFMADPGAPDANSNEEAAPLQPQREKKKKKRLAPRCLPGL